MTLSVEPCPKFSQPLREIADTSSFFLQKVIKDTFAFDQVPIQAYRIGLAGVLPYLATASATVVCAFELNTASTHGGFGFLMSEHTAELCLQVLEPLQVGYGAVVSLLKRPRYHDAGG